MIIPPPLIILCIETWVLSAPISSSRSIAAREVTPG